MHFCHCDGGDLLLCPVKLSPSILLVSPPSLSKHSASDWISPLFSIFFFNIPRLLKEANSISLCVCDVTYLGGTHGYTKYTYVPEFPTYYSIQENCELFIVSFLWSLFFFPRKWICELALQLSTYRNPQNSSPTCSHSYTTFHATTSLFLFNVFTALTLTLWSPWL